MADPTPKRTSVAGTRYGGGRLYGYEASAALRGAAWIERCNKMQRSDPFIFAASEGLTQTLKSARWSLEHAPRRRYKSKREYLEAKRLREFIDAAWDAMTVPWEAQIGYLSRYVFNGWRYGERVYACFKHKGKVRVGLSHIADCEPSAHARWLSDDGETLTGVEQYDRSYARGKKGRRSNPTTPADRLLLLTHGQTGSNWEGNGGVLRPASGAYEAKCHAIELRGVSADRWASATPIGKFNRQEMLEAGFGAAQIKAERAALSAELKKYASGEEASFVLPAGMDLEQFGGTYASAPLNDTITRCNSEILMAFLQPFLGMGLNDSSGSRALSSLSETHFRRWAVNVLDHIANCVNGPQRPGAGIIGDLIERNFPGTDPALYPRLVHKGLQADAFLDLAGVLASWAGSGLTAVGPLVHALCVRMGVEPTDELIEAFAAAANASDGAYADNGKPGTGRPADEGGAEDPTEHIEGET